jgi:hypothetical protein
MERSRHEDSAHSLLYPTHAYPYTAGLAGGLLGGLAMTLPALAYGLLSGHGLWYPVNLVAATILRYMQTWTTPQVAAFDPPALVVGLAIHLVVATLVGLIFAILLPTLPGRPQIWALIVGPLLWGAAVWVILPVLNPLMAQLLDWPSFGFANLIYGLVMGFWVAHTPLVPAHTAHHLRLHRPSFLK